tara:strand:- start:49 stop:387 length:339 start_codon:yes stop_codon:yes gene_type:complete
MEKEMEMLDQIIVEIPGRTPPIAYYADDKRLIQLAWTDHAERMHELLDGVEESELTQDDWFEYAVEAIGQDLASMEIIENELELFFFLEKTGHQIDQAQRAVSKLLRTGYGY